ncbi:MAG: sugar ABC transporter permease [Betaproteobacteria bacterium]
MSIERQLERPLWYLLPSAALFGVVTLFPLAWVAWLSLRQHSFVQAHSGFVGAENYLRMAGDVRFWNALGNTVYFTGFSVALELVLGLIIALLLHRATRGKGVLYAIVLIPWVVPTAVSARMWEWMYNADLGVLNYMLHTHINWLGSPTWALHAAIAMDVWKTTPFVALLLIAGLNSIPRDVYHAAALDGAGAWMVLRRVTLPLLAPFILVVLVFRTIDAFRVFDTLYVLTGGGPADTTETLSLYAYKMLFQALDLGYGSAIAVAVFACVAVTTVLYARLLRGALA